MQGLDALPRVVETLARFEPAVLLSADGRGALYAPRADGRRERRLWLLADARTALEWEAGRRHVLVLTFQSRDERVFAQVTGRTEPVVDTGIAGQLWRQSFRGGSREGRTIAAAARPLQRDLGGLLREPVGTRQRAPAALSCPPRSVTADVGELDAESATIAAAERLRLQMSP